MFNSSLGNNSRRGAETKSYCLKYFSNCLEVFVIEHRFFIFYGK